MCKSKRTIKQLNLSVWEMSVDSHSIKGETPSRKAMLGPVQVVGPKYLVANHTITGSFEALRARGRHLRHGSAPRSLKHRFGTPQPDEQTRTCRSRPHQPDTKASILNREGRSWGHVNFPAVNEVSERVLRQPVPHSCAPFHPTWCHTRARLRNSAGGGRPQPLHHT